MPYLIIHMLPLLNAAIAGAAAPCHFAVACHSAVLPSPRYACAPPDRAQPDYAARQREALRARCRGTMCFYDVMPCLARARVDVA